VSCGPLGFLNDPDSSLDFRDMFIPASKIDSWSIGHGLCQCLQRRKFAIGMHGCDFETTMEIKLAHLLKRFENSLDLSVGVLFTKKISAVKNISEWSFKSSLGMN
jgi:hypothetical protein